MDAPDHAIAGMNLHAARMALAAARKRASWSVRARVASHPAYLHFARRKYPQNAVRADTEIVIDGFMRTASTFAVVAFQMSQPAPVRVAHHLHAPAQIVAGARMGIPVIVTVRAPEESVLSTSIWEPHIGLEQALRAYAAFYAALVPWRSHVVVAGYERVTTDFGSVIEETNRRFGTAFAPFASTPAALEECFSLIDDRSRRPAWDAVIGDFLSGYASRERLDDVRAAARSRLGADRPTPASRVARPSSRREVEKDRLRGAYRSEPLARLRMRAEEAYRAFVGAHAVVSPKR